MLLRLIRGCAPAVALALAAVFVGKAAAQAYPTKPVRLIVASPPGSLPDTLARAIGHAAGEAFGQPIVVDARGGANGNIGMEACVRAAADGYSICMASGAIIALNPFAYARMPFELDDLVPVVHMADFDQAIGVATSVPVTTMRELIEYGRAKPGALSWASLGNGSVSHLYLEWLQAKTGAKFVHVPYRGSPDALRAVGGAEAHATQVTPNLFLPVVQSGKARVVGVVSGARRTVAFPEVPTLIEQGFDLDFRNWVALYFQRGVPNEAVQRWNTEVNRLLKQPEFVQRYVQTLGLTPTGGTPEALREAARRSRTAGAELARIANLKFD